VTEPRAAPVGEPRPVFAEHDGVRVAVLDWGGAPGARPLVLLHPNGFCAGLFDPVARRLAAGGAFRPVGVDLRGHGGSDKPEPPEPYTYEHMAGDVLAVLDTLGFDEVDIAGGSLGGGVAIHVDRRQPGRARRLLLCEPIAFPMPGGITTRDGPHPMAVGALRRRVVWASREAMTLSYASRPPLDRLAPEALAAYIAWGTVDRPGGPVELACPPAVEAAIFAGPPALRGVHAAWEHLPQLTASVAVLAGDRSFVPRERSEAVAAAAGVPLVVVPGDHFFLHEDTARGVALIEEHLGHHA
jgi:pimeloyl-ACP methyl ester carboxylesterase